MLTFEQFSASGRDVPDLAIEHPGLDLEGIAGRVFIRPGGPYLERHEEHWILILGNLEWEADDNPADRLRLERVLYDWAKGEGYMDERAG